MCQMGDDLMKKRGILCAIIPGVVVLILVGLIIKLTFFKEDDQPLTQEITGKILENDETSILICDSQNEQVCYEMLISDNTELYVSEKYSKDLIKVDITEFIVGQSICVTYSGKIDENNPIIHDVVSITGEYVYTVEGSVEEVLDGYILIAEEDDKNSLCSVNIIDVRIYVDGVESDASKLQTGQHICVKYIGSYCEIDPAEITGVIQINVE